MVFVVAFPPLALVSDAHGAAAQPLLALEGDLEVASGLVNGRLHVDWLDGRSNR